MGYHWLFNSWTIHFDLKDNGIKFKLEQFLNKLRSAAKHNIDLHPVFETEVMKNMSNFLISTSTLNSNAVSLGAFGPVGTVNPETNKPVSVLVNSDFSLSN